MLPQHEREQQTRSPARAPGGFAGGSAGPMWPHRCAAEVLTHEQRIRGGEGVSPAALSGSAPEPLASSPDVIASCSPEVAMRTERAGEGVAEGGVLGPGSGLRCSQGARAPRASWGVKGIQCQPLSPGRRQDGGSVCHTSRAVAAPVHLWSQPAGRAVDVRCPRPALGATVLLLPPTCWV